MFSEEQTELANQHIPTLDNTIVGAAKYSPGVGRHGSILGVFRTASVTSLQSTPVFIIPRTTFMTSQIPPAYSTAVLDSNYSIGDSEVPPPTYTAPTQFNIGVLRTSEPLVNVSQVKGHLALLHAFAELKKQVEGLQEPIPQMPADLERRWAWFVALAVERSVSILCFVIFILFNNCRFETWCHQLRSSDAENNLEVILPPIDVMMVRDH